MDGDFRKKLRLILTLLLTCLFVSVAVAVGFLGHFFYWLFFDIINGGRQRNKRKLHMPKDLASDNEYYALIIGSGFSGLGTAIKLNELGMDNYVIIERHGHIGGTWYANKYPGCACDIPSNLYSFSFEPNPKWSHFYSRQPEIGQYLEHCTNKYDIHRHIRFNTTVTQLRWIDERKAWQITTQAGEEEKHIYARFVMVGCGPLPNASYPSDIPGVDQFEGEMCHTAEWKKNIEFGNKRVAVIGTGASAAQTVPEIQKTGIKQLLIFQRTPSWILPRLDRKVSDWEKRIFERFPILQKSLRVLVYWLFETFVFSFAYRLPTRFLFTKLAKYYLQNQVKDEELRKKLTPSFELGCKRVLFTHDWYSAIRQANAQVITNRIREIRSNSIVTYDGDEYPVDVIVWSTGFQVHKFSLPIYGVNGRSLAEQWSETVQVSNAQNKDLSKCLTLITGVSWSDCAEFSQPVFSFGTEQPAWPQLSSDNG